MKSKKWTEIWESEEYKVEIYDRCTTRVYSKDGSEKLKVEVDGAKWHGDTGGFHTWKYFITGDDAINLRKIIEESDEDEAAEYEVQQEIDRLIRLAIDIIICPHMR